MKLAAPIPRSRLRLALLSLLVMGAILYGAGFGMFRLLMRAHRAALEQEVETLAGTLHDSLKPLLPAEARPSAELASVLPGLCLAGRPCLPQRSLVERHAESITDSERYQVRILDGAGTLLAHSPGAEGRSTALPEGEWSEVRGEEAGRFLQYTIHLHHSHAAPSPRSSDVSEEWGYLQIGRSLAGLEAERERLIWIGHSIFLLALALAGLASWWLSGLAMRPLLEAYRRQEQFTADAAHELRAPLANLLATVEACRTASPPDRSAVERTLEVVQQQGRRLSRLIADLLLLARLEEQDPAGSLDSCRLAEIASDLAEEYAEVSREAGVRLRLDLQEPDLTVKGMESELYRLVANLLANAIHYTPPGGEVVLSLRREGNRAVLEVSDSGIGISPADQRRVFDRFYRSDPGRTRRGGGTGLGLSIVAAIVRRHHGRVSVSSTPGQGSVFTVEMPLSG
ncbi:MAG: two-component system sensor histidine kinase RppB [Synechococcaceae cyanobacterium]|nr:two-component system sensor histidine kinase RppB [Synechococcaceae cyanobacterium]